MSVISSDEEVGLHINACYVITEFLYILYNETRNMRSNIIIDEFIMLVIGFLSYKRFFRDYKICRLIVLYLWYMNFNIRTKAYYDRAFIWFEHLRTFGFLCVGLLPFIRGG